MKRSPLPSRRQDMTKEKSTAEASGVDQEGSTASSRATAGRELDGLVALEVMGWTRVNGAHTYPNGHTWYVLHGFPPGASAPAEIPHYSTDIATAMEISPILREKGWVYFTIQSLPESTDAIEWDDTTMRLRWWAGFSRYRSPVEVTSPHCDTPALAICLAALMSVGVFPTSIVTPANPRFAADQIIQAHEEAVKRAKTRRGV